MELKRSFPINYQLKLKILFKKLVLISLLFFCLGCSPKTRLFVFTDEFFWKLINTHAEPNQDPNRPTQGELKLIRMAKDRGLRWQLKLTNLREHNVSALSEVLTLNQQSVVLVSPLVMLEVEQLMNQFPNSAFITLDSVPQDLMAPNLLTVTFDRRVIYKDLGQQIFQLMQKPAFVKALDVLPPGLTPPPQLSGSPGATGTTPEPVKLGILAIYPTKRSREELVSFKAGLIGSGRPDLVMEKEFVLNPGSQPELLPVFDEMYKAGVRIFFLKMYNFTDACLELIKARGGQAIVEDGGPLQAVEPCILLSIDEDYFSSLQAALAQVTRGAKGITIKSKSLPGKFTLNWKKSLQLK